MATTEQRSGFRLPWASDAAPENADGATAHDLDSHEPSAHEPSVTAWPEADAAAGDGAAPISGTTPPAAAAILGAVPPRRENPLVAGLVRAMREAAATARSETTARFAEESKARLEAVHAKSAVEVTELRRLADGDIAQIRDWSKTEMARIRESTERRIADRRGRLEAEMDAHAALVERRMEHVRKASAAFDAEMDSFFERLLREEDPARLAGLAEQLPEPPELTFDDDEMHRPVGLATLDDDGAAAAEAETLGYLAGGPDGSDADGPDSDAADGDDADGPARGEGPVHRDDDPAAGEDPDAAQRITAFTDALAEAAAGARGPAPVDTRVSVAGLATVASISGFKRAISRVAGVRSVTVASGTGGDFLFTLSHDPDTDIRSILTTLDGFGASIQGDSDGVLSVTASDPDGGPR